MANLLPNTLEVQIVRMVKALYDAAPGFTYLSALKGVGSVSAVSAQLNSNFASLTNAQWAALIVTNLHISAISGAAAATEAQNYLIAQLAGGMTRTALLPDAMAGFATLEGSATFGASALYFNNSNATAYQYSINPANTTTDLATLQLADEPNTAPVVGNDTAAATEGGAMIAGTMRTNDSDAQGDTLTYALAVTQAPVAGLTLNSNGSYTFDPAGAAYNDILAGAVRNVVVTVTVSDGEGGSTNGTLTIAVTGTNDAPSAATVFASGAEDSAFIVVTPSSTDPDTGDTATYAVVSNPTSGSVSLVAGQFQYVPNPNFSGTDSFQYRVTDGSGASSVATANVTVTAVNDAPVANASSANGVEDTPIGGTVTGSDTEGSALTFAVATGPANGTVVLSTNGAYVYTPAANFNGSDSFTFTASDGLATSAPRTVTITVAAANDAPVAANVFATGAEDAAGINVAPSSSDIDVGDTATYSVNSQPGHGSVTFSGGQFVYVPALNFNGVDTFTYRVTDSAGASSVATATVTVQAVNDAPVAIAGSATGNQDTVITGTVTGTDIDGDSLSYTVSTQATNGSVSINNANGNYVYTPNAGYVGADQFTFTVNDGRGGTSTAVVSLTVADVADVLTVGVDNVILSGSTPQTVIGNQFTYNPGDSITGGTGSDTLSLGLTPMGPIVLGSATVTGIENFNVTINPALATDNVTLQMTTVSTHLTNVNVTQSNGHSISIVDVQNLPRFKLDDVGAQVTINIDNQVVAGGADALTIDVKEFGTNSSSTFGRSILTVDRGLETININDLAASSGFASDMKRIDVNGDAGNGYSNLNITGGSTGTSLTIQDAGSEAGGFMTSAPSYGAVQANSTTFLGNLIADVDGAGGGSGTVRTGVGADVLTAHDDFAGLVNAGAGNDTIQVLSQIAGGADDLPDLQGTIEGAAGNDTITVAGDMDSGSFARIDGGDGNDSVNVAGFVDSTGSIIGGNNDDGITVGGNLAGSVTGDDGNDNITILGGISSSGSVSGGNGIDSLWNSGGDMLGSMFGGADNDTIQNNAVLGDNSAASNRGVLDGGSGNDNIYNYGVMEEGSSMIGGDGDDFLYLSGSLLEGNQFDLVFDFQTAALISGGEGNDTAQILGTVDGDVDMGNGNDTVQVHRNVNANVRTGSITLGDGDDIVELFDGASFTGDGESGDGLNNDGSIDGGSGNNVMNIHLRGGAREAEVASDGTPVGPPSDGTDITNIQTLNLNTLDLVEEIIDVEQDHTFDINLQAFDTTLATINVLERDDAATVNLGGYNSEIVNIDSDGDAGTDVTLNVGANAYGEDGTGNNAGNDDNGQLNGSGVGGLRDANETLNVNLNGASAAYEVAINDAAGVNLTNLSSNGSGARTAMLDGMDQDNAGGAGTSPEGNSLNITGNNTSRLTVTGIYQETVNAAAYAGALTLTIANDDTDSGDGDGANDNERLTINTGNGDDVVNIVADILDLGDIAFNLGGGNDRLIVNESTRDLGGVDEDQVFKRISGTEELEVRGSDATNGAAKLLVSVEDDSRNSGLRKLIVTNDGASAGNVDLDIDADYNNGSAGLRLTVEARSGDVNIDNGANVDLTVNLWANSSTSGGAVAGAGVVFAQTGSGAVDVAIAINQSGTTTVSASTLAGPLTANPATIGHVRMDVLGGAIDSLAINEGTFRADNGPINVTWNDNWAGGGVFTVNATDITNDDFDINVGNQNTHTGGMRFIGVAEDDVNMTILATANDDSIWGSQRSDSINGGLGNDWIKADPLGPIGLVPGAVVTPGVQMVKTVDFNEADNLDAGDKLSVTVGNTTFTYTASSDANTVADAVTNLAGQINGANVDADGDADVSAVANTLTGTLTITGIDVDSDFGYALGENIAVSSTVLDRPVAVITVASEGYDIGDVLTINVDGTLYSTTVGVGSTASTLAAALATAVDAHATLVASANGNAVSISSTTALTTYTITPSWTIDQLTTPATSKTATVTYSVIGGGETVSVTFAGGITVSSSTVAGLAVAINGNGTLAPQWNASALGNVLTLATDVAGAATPANDFSTANFNGSGTAIFGTVSGTNAIVRTDNTDPTIGARAVSFALNNAWYDGGDSVTVAINGVPYTFTLPSVGEDPDFTGAQAAAAIAAATPAPALPPGYTVSSLNNVVSITAPDNVALPTWSLSLADVAPVNAQPEINDVLYTAFVDAANDNLSVSMTIGAATYSGDTIATLIAAINVGTGTHGYTASVGGTALTVRLTGNASGVEPASSNDNGQITGTLQAFGGAVTPVSDTGAFAVQRIEDVDFTAFTLADGAGVTVGGTSYFTIDRGTANDTLNYLIGLINADTLTHLYVASLVDGDTIRLTGPVVAQGGNANPVGGSAALVFPDGGDVTAAAATAGVGAIPEFYTVAATGFDAPTDSVSIRFDTDGTAGPSLGDISISGNSWASLAQAINDAIVALDLSVAQISGATAFANRVEIYGPGNGGASTTPPIGATFAGTGGPASVSFTAAGAAATPWSQVVTLSEFDVAGETAYVILSNGTVVSFVSTGAEAADLTTLAGLIETALGLVAASSTISAAGNTITLNGNVNGSNPALSVATVLAGDILGASAGGAVNQVVLGVAADAYDVTIDFSLINTDEPPAGKVSEVAEVILAGNLRYSATSVAALVLVINNGSATLPATGPNPASILGHGWTASAVGDVLTLSGNINGTAPNILFDSARLVETQGAVPSEAQESWHNLDNTAPVLQVLSGNANSNPALATTTADVAAATATGNGNDVVNGGGGNDVILGVGGDDQLNGDDGNDTIEGGTGNDVINGGNGADLIDGGAGADVLNGGADNDTIIGAGDNDSINGGEGHNRLFGGDGNDTITAGSGNDFIRGGAGKDMLTGGAGIDTFYFTTIGGSESQGAVGFSDSVSDFVSGTDKFQFSFTVNFYANVNNTTNLLAGLTDSSVAAGAHAGRAIYDSSAKVLYIDVNGDGAITATDDLVIDLTLTGVSGLSSSDFLGAMPPPGV